MSRHDDSTEWHALIVILYDTCLHFRSQISDNGATLSYGSSPFFRYVVHDDDDDDDDDDEDGDGYWLRTANWTTTDRFPVGKSVPTDAPSGNVFLFIFCLFLLAISPPPPFLSPSVFIFQNDFHSSKRYNRTVIIDGRTCLVNDWIFFF